VQLTHPRIAVFTLLGALALLPSLPAGAETLDEVVARYVAARGGSEAWQRAQSLRQTGRFTSFSLENPFELLAQRPNLFRRRAVSLDGPYTHGFDGKEPYWIQPFEENVPKKPDAPYDGLLTREADFEPALLGYAAKGHRAELLAPGDIDGQVTVQIKLVRQDGAEEIWHLDPKTGLEVAVDSTTWDFTLGEAPLAQRAFFSDWKTIEGLVLPMRIERQWGPRYSLTLVEKVEVNPKIAPGTFERPAAPAPAAPPK
jgi:hypothetical protein